MKHPNWQTVDLVRAMYPKGTIVSLRKMSDAYAPPVGTLGVVEGVDPCANVMIRWQNGRHMSVLYGIDRIDVVLPARASTR